MNFYEFYQILNENTVSQELKKILKERDDWHKKFLEEVISRSKNYLRGQNIKETAIEIFAKWIFHEIITSVKSNLKDTDAYGRHNSKTILDYYFEGNFEVRDFLAANVDQNGNWNPQLASKFNNPNFKHFNLRELSSEWHQNLQKQRGNIPGAPGKIVISFPDGYKWVNLNKDYCEREGRAGLHCGNVGRRPGDTILSLRDSRDHVYLTFVLNNGVLVERKAKQNLKPKKEYHSYILELLKLPIVKDLGKGRHDPPNDFQLFDLSKEQLDEILNIKPTFEKSLLLNYFNNFIETQNFDSRPAMIEKVKSLEADFPTKIKRELSLVFKYTYEYNPSKHNIDEVFSESELLEILNNEKIINLDNAYKSTMGEMLDIFETIAKETKSEKVQKEIFEMLSSKQKPRGLSIQNLLLNKNISNEVEKKLPEMIRKQIGF